MPLIIIPGPTIPAGGFLSNSVDIGGQDILRVIMPPAWATSGPLGPQSAVLTFQLSPDGITYYDAYNEEGQEVQMPVVPGVIIVTGRGIWAMSIANIKFRSGTSRSPVVQPVDRVFKLVTGK